MRQQMSASASPTRAQAQALREVEAAAAQAQLEMRELSNEMGRVRSQSRSGGLFQSFYGDSRKAMSMAQRLRGEVLALTTAYVGLYGAISGVGDAVNAYRAIEAAQNRLGAAFNQNTAQVENEMKYIERQADRLGIRFNVMAENYAKFAIAGRQSNYSGEAIREIFESVAEAGRVMKLSEDQIRGIFLALEQSANKGKFAAQEVRQQLGERLPGAFNILAKALGVTTEQLDEMMEKGEVLATEENMLAFARQLRKEFGGQLPEALESFTTQIGRFQNEIFKAQLRVAKGGLVEGMADALEELNAWFQSDDGREFFLSLGKAAGNFISVLAEIPQHLNVIIPLFKLFIGLKLVLFFRDLYRQVVLANRTLVTLGATMRGVGTSSLKASGTIGGFVTNLRSARSTAIAARTAVTALSAALTRIPVVAIFTAASYVLTDLLGDWLAGVDDVTDALDDHEVLMQKVLAGYDEAADKSSDWAKNLDNVSLIELEKNFQRLDDAQEKALDKLRSKLTSIWNQDIREPFDGFGLFDSEAENILEEWAGRMRNLTRDQVPELREALKRLNEEIDDPAVKRAIQRIDEYAEEVEKLDVPLERAAVAAKEKGSNLERVAEVSKGATFSLNDLAEASRESGDAMDESRKKAEAFREALDGIKKAIPGLAREMEKTKALAELDAYWKTMTETGTPTAADRRLYEVARANVIAEHTDYAGQYTATRYSGGDQSRQLAEIVRESARVAEELGISAKDLLTAISYETGGTFDPAKVGPTTKWGQHIGLIQMGEPQRQKYGYDPYGSIESQMEAVKKYLIDAGVKAGDGLLQVYAAINAGGVNNINASDAAAGGRPGTVLDKYQNELPAHEARVTGLLEAYSGVAERGSEIAKEAERAAQQREKERQATADTLADLGFQIEQQQLINSGLDREAAIQEAIRQAREQNPGITQEEINKVAELTGRLYDLENATKSATDAEEEVNRLLSLQNELRSQLEIYKSRGDFEAARQTETQLNSVNRQLEASIDKAIAMWRAIGGPEADLAIAKLQTTKLELQDVGRQAVVTREEFINMATSGIVNMFDEFAQAVAEGENAWDAFIQAFLRAAAQFLIKLGQMYVEQAAFNALQAAMPGAGGGGGGFFGSLFSGIGRIFTGFFHDGGLVSEPTDFRPINPAWFKNAVYLHDGGMPKLASNEVPAVLEDDEEVLTRDDPRHILNGGGSGGGNNVKIVNAFDQDTVVSEGLQSEAGQEVLLNFIRRNRSTIKGVLG